MAVYEKVLSNNSNYKLVLTVTAGTQNIANNTTAVSWSLVIKKLAGSGYYSGYGTPKWSVNIGGVTASGTLSKSGSWYYDFRKYTTLTLGSGTATITHSADGTKSITSSGTFTDGSPVTIGGGTASGTMTLTTIPRASSFGTITGSTIGSGITVNITRASSSFTHSLWYSFGSKTWQGIGSSLGTSATFTPPLSLGSEIPNTTSGTMTLILRTFNGSTQIGSDVTKTITVSLPASVKPTIGSLTAAEDGTSWGVYIQNRNKVKVTLGGAAGSYGSTISSYSISGGGSSSTSTTLSLTPSTVGTITFSATVTDSRGRTSDAKTVNINVLTNTASTFAAISATNLGSAISVAITKSNSSYKHIIKYKKTNGTTVNITSSATAESTVSYTLPLSDSTLLPNATSGTATIILETYYGSIKIGSDYTRTFTVNVPESVKPTAGTLTLTQGNANNAGTYVQGLSSVKFTLSGHGGAQSSTISSVSITGGGQTFTTTTGTSNILNLKGNVTFTATVTDSRGRRASTTATVSFLEYTAPKINSASVTRTNSSGVAQGDGTSISYAYNITVAGLSVGGVQKNNIKEVKFECKKTTDSSYGTPFGTVAHNTVLTINTSKVYSTVSTTYSYDARLTVTDNMGKTAIWTGRISAGALALDIGDNNIGVGHAWKRGTIDSAGQIYQNDGLAVMDEYSVRHWVVIPNNSNFNDYVNNGRYGISSNSNAGTMTNIPTQTAGWLDVRSLRNSDVVPGSSTATWANVLQTYTTLSGSRYERTISSDGNGAWTYGGWTRSRIALDIYPVGAVYISVTSTNPGTYLGGTWIRFGGGHALVGVNENDTSFASALTAGGSKTATLSTANLPSHNHSFSATTGSAGAHTHTVSGTAASAGAHTHSGTTASAGAHTHNAWSRSVYAGGDTYSGVTFQNGASWQPNAIQSAGAHTHTFTTGSAGAHTHTVSGTAASAGAHTHSVSGNTGSTGSGSAFSILQPYITVYFWRRTA